MVTIVIALLDLFVSLVPVARGILLQRYGDFYRSFPEDAVAKYVGPMYCASLPRLGKGREAMARISLALKTGTTILVQGPAGIGKTQAVLSSCLGKPVLVVAPSMLDVFSRSLSARLGALRKIVVVIDGLGDAFTAATSGSELADALRRLAQHGLRVIGTASTNSLLRRKYSWFSPSQHFREVVQLPCWDKREAANLCRRVRGDIDSFSCTPASITRGAVSIRSTLGSLDATSILLLRALALSDFLHLGSAVIGIKLRRLHETTGWLLGVDCQWGSEASSIVTEAGIASLSDGETISMSSTTLQFMLSQESTDSRVFWRDVQRLGEHLAERCDSPALISLSWVALMNGQPSIAKCLAQLALSLAPGAVGALECLARAHVALAEADKALECIDQHRQISGAAQIHEIAGEAYALEGLSAEAINEYRTVIQLAPYHSIAYGKMAEAQVALGDRDAAIGTLANGIEQDAANFDLYFQKSKLEERDNVEDAIATISELLRVTPSARGYEERGKLRLNSGRHADAIADFSSAVNLTPSDATTDMLRRLAYRIVSQFRDGQYLSCIEASECFAELPGQGDPDEARNRYTILVTRSDARVHSLWVEKDEEVHLQIAGEGAIEFAESGVARLPLEWTQEQKAILRLALKEALGAQAIEPHSQSAYVLASSIYSILGDPTNAFRIAREGILYCSRTPTLMGRKAQALLTLGDASRAKGVLLEALSVARDGVGTLLVLLAKAQATLKDIEAARETVFRVLSCLSELGVKAQLGQLLTEYPELWEEISEPDDLYFSTTTA